MMMLESEKAFMSNNWIFNLGDLVRKKTGSQWQGKVVGFYQTKLTQRGYCVESDSHAGSVQIYPEAALERVLESGVDK